jgi:hypothetical protein
MKTITWHKSTYSSPEGASCIEQGQTTEDGSPVFVFVRDTKQNGRGPILAFAPNAWAAFVMDAREAPIG